MAAAVRRERGFALLMVLWTLLLLAFIATVFSDNARTEVLLARNLVANARAEALADGGVYRAALGLARSPRSGGFRGDGQVYIWHPTSGDAGRPGSEQSAGEQVRFTIRDEGGKVNLNQASPALLRELLIVVGVDPQQSVELADAIVDFRDEDGDKERHGAEGREYKQARLPWGPKNKPFVLIDELTYVLGMTPDIYRRVSPLLTIWGQGEEPHPYTAPPEVVAAIKAALKTQRGRATADNRSGGPEEDDIGASTRSAFAAPRPGESTFGDRGFAARSGSAFGAGRSRTGSEGALTEEDEANVDQLERSGSTVFSVHAEGRTADGTVFARDATIDLTGTEEAPLAIRSWRQGERVLFPVEAGSGG
jgi:general secretion pathway protein K